MLKATSEKGNETLNPSANPITKNVLYQHPTGSFAQQVGRFLLHFLELQIPMGLGALICYLLTRMLPASSNFAAVYHPGTYLYAFGDVLFLTVPVVVWMVIRGYDWRHSLEMAAAMLAPIAAIVLVSELAGFTYLLWLLNAGYPAMCLGILVYMLYRRNYLLCRKEIFR